MEPTSLTVTVYRRSLLPRPVKPSQILLDDMNVGWIRDGRFVPGEQGEEAVIAYHSHHIGRGIRISWKNADVRFTELKLELPASEEEIDDFFLMAARLARQDICEVYFNAEPFVPKQYHAKKDAWKTANLRLLHTAMGEVLNEASVLKLNSVFRCCYAGMEEAETMWAGIDSSALRDWLHATQDTKRFYSCYDAAAIPERLVIPVSRPAVLPDAASLQSADCRICIQDAEENRTLAEVRPELLFDVLSDAGWRRLDAGMIEVDALDEEILQRLESSGALHE